MNIGYTYDMRVYLGRDSHSATDEMTATYATVRHLTRKAEGFRQSIYGQFLYIPKTF